MRGFERRDGELHCDGVPLSVAAERHGTPLYVYSRAAIEDAWAGYARAFAPARHLVHYALKANPARALLRLLAGLGAGADVVSGGELRAALAAGFAAAKTVFSGVGKTDAELALAIETGVGVNAESEDEIERLAGLAERASRRVRLALRVNPDIAIASHPYIATGLRQSKFGVPIEAAPGLLQRAASLGSLEVVGVSCHIGSQLLDLAPVEAAVGAVARLSRELLDAGLPLRSIDIGGGLGVAYDGRGAPGPGQLAERVLPLVEGLGLELQLEPGRSLVAAAGALVTRVLLLKSNHERRFVVVDAAMNDLMRPALYDAHHRIEPVGRSGGPLEICDVVGPVCESGDFLARGLELPRPAPGELLAVRDAGAYGSAMASNYNLRGRAAEALAEAGGLRLIRRRESFEDLVDREVDEIPEPT
jgi:diaminopimelate decarboxylase